MKNSLRQYVRLLLESADQDLATAEGLINKIGRSIRRTDPEGDTFLSSLKVIEKFNTELKKIEAAIGKKQSMAPGINSPLENITFITSSVQELLDKTTFWNRPTFLGRKSYVSEVAAKMDEILSLIEAFNISTNEYRFARDIGTSRATKWKARR